MTQIPLDAYENARRPDIPDLRFTLVAGLCFVFLACIVFPISDWFDQPPVSLDQSTALVGCYALEHCGADEEEFLELTLKMAREEDELYDRIRYFGFHHCIVNYVAPFSFMEEEDPGTGGQ